MTTKREEPESNEDKAKQAAKQEQARGIPREAIVDPGTPSINEPPGSDVMPPEAKAAIEQANKDAAQQAQPKPDDDDDDKKGKRR